MANAAASGSTKASTKKAQKKKSDPADDQGYLAEDLEPVRIPAIDKLAKAYRDARDSRQAILLEEVELKGKLTAAMDEHSLKEYVVAGQGLKVVLMDKHDVKVKKAREPKDDEVNV